MRATSLLVISLCVAGCGGGATRSPPPALAFDGLPVSGTLDQVRKAGFTRCYADTTFMRCRRDGITFQGSGPYNAAVDLNGNDGAGGFDHLTIWSDVSQSALMTVTNQLRMSGWAYCYNGRNGVGQDAIFTRPDAAVQIVVDMSYWGKRRLRIFPAGSQYAPRCATPTAET